VLSALGSSLPARLASLEMTCDYAAIQRFAVLSDDFNPIHVDREFAARSELGGIVAHGPMSLGLLWRVLASSLGLQTLQSLTLDVRFRRPVRENDRIVAGGQLRAEHPATYDVWVKNQDAETVIEGEVRIGPAGTELEPCAENS
jgi:3-hydroxybutyryl-CoA dehydratase